MSGDTYTPPHYEHSTSFDDGDVLDFQKRSSEAIRPYPVVEAERIVREAYGQHLAATPERVVSPVEIAGQQLAFLQRVRQQDMTIEDRTFLRDAA